MSLSMQSNIDNDWSLKFMAADKLNLNTQVC